MKTFLLQAPRDFVDAGIKKGYIIQVPSQVTGSSPQAYVWKQGMPQWQMAGEVQELTPLFQGAVPQMPPMPGM